MYSSKEILKAVVFTNDCDAQGFFETTDDVRENINMQFSSAMMFDKFKCEGEVKPNQLYLYSYDYTLYDSKKGELKADATICYEDGDGDKIYLYGITD